MSLLNISQFAQVGDDLTTLTARNNIAMASLPGRLIGSYTGPHLLRASTSISRGTFRTEHVARANCSGLRVAWYGGNSTAVPPTSESGFGNPVELKASLELPGGVTPIPLWFGGKRRVRLLPGQLLISDPLDAWLSTGDVFYIRCFASRLKSDTFSTGWTPEPGLITADQTSLPFHNFSLGATYSDNSGFAGDNSTAVDPYAQDFSDSGAVANTAGNPIFRPLAIVASRLGTTWTPGVAIIGDSITYGIGDQQNGINAGAGATKYDGAGWAQRGLADNYPTTRVAITSEGVLHLVGTNTRNWSSRFTVSRWADYALVAYGNNDIAAGRSLGTIQADFLTFIGRLRDAGLRVVATTVLPRTTSTDFWRTAANQTGWAFESVRTGFNAWLATQVGVTINGLVSLESALVSSGKWLAPEADDISSVTSAGSTTTVVQVTGLVANAHVGKVLVTGGASSIIFANTATTVTVSPALGAAPGTGVAYTIVNAYTNDGIHPTSRGHAAAAAALSAAAPGLFIQ